MKKNIINYLLLFVGCFWLFSNNIYADKCRFYVGNEYIDEDNSEITDGKGGKVTIDGKTVTFDNFTFEGEGRIISNIDNDYFGEDTTIYTALSAVCGGTYNFVLKGKNTIKIDSSKISKNDAKGYVNIGLYFTQALKFNGDGELDIYTDDTKEYLGSIGIYAENGINIKNSTVKIHAYKAIGPVVGLASYYGTLLEKANVQTYLASSDSEYSESYGIYGYYGLTSVGSNIVVDVKDGNNLRGLYLEGGIILNGTSLDLNVGKAKRWSFGITSNDGGLYVNEGSFKAFSEGRVLNIDDDASFNATSVLLGSNDELANSFPIDFINYNDKKVVVSENNTKISFSEWDYETALSNYKYLKIIPEETAGKFTIETSNDKYNIISKDLIKLIPLTEYENTRLESGDDISIRLRVSDSKEDVSTEDQELINDNLDDNKIGSYLDVSLFKKVGNMLEEKLSVLNYNMKLSFELDNELINKNKSIQRTYKVVRVHDGEVTYLDTTFDEKTNTITFESDSFSSYALLYADKDITTENPQTADNIMNYIILAVISLISIVGTIIYRKNKSNA